MDSSYIKNLMNGITDLNLQRVLKTAFDYLDTNLSFGRATGETSGTAVAAGVVPSQNFSGGFFSGKTPAAANTEFKIQHTFNRAPYLLLQVLPLDQSNAAIVRLTVSRPADASYVYLKSPETSQPIFLYLEG